MVSQLWLPSHKRTEECSLDPFGCGWLAGTDERTRRRKGVSERVDTNVVAAWAQEETRTQPPIELGDRKRHDTHHGGDGESFVSAQTCNILERSGENFKDQFVYIKWILEFFLLDNQQNSHSVSTYSRNGYFPHRRQRSG